ncbi:hypothetical protein T265_04021 [Opisthorchis viverrini]|uniref:Uncharacterized protein n=1 Tax=Opisthorchis viverrini TaxID=6198 RepID=A0A075AH52_OPIVI|nr:hypothetical protein T265_04021 [Opisthorchis viverrini]KER29369.1 hypothetical protein T265_04021 [Opisthorchis viverrini]
MQLEAANLFRIAGLVNFVMLLVFSDFSDHHHHQRQQQIAVSREHHHRKRDISVQRGCYAAVQPSFILKPYCEEKNESGWEGI